MRRLYYAYTLKKGYEYDAIDSTSYNDFTEFLAALNDIPDEELYGYSVMKPRKVWAGYSMTWEVVI